MTRDEKFFELDREFSRNHAKFAWWNGAEFGTILGMILTLFIKAVCYWFLFAAFCVEFGFAWYYQRCDKKILAEMENLMEKDTQNV